MLVELTVKVYNIIHNIEFIDKWLKTVMLLFGFQVSIKRMFISTSFLISISAACRVLRLL